MVLKKVRHKRGNRGVYMKGKIKGSVHSGRKKRSGNLTKTSKERTKLAHRKEKLRTKSRWGKRETLGDVVTPISLWK